MKYYDRGFISKYENYINVQIFSAGTAVLNLDIYEDKICKDNFQCQSSSSFNKEFLHKSYKKTFLKEIFSQDKKEIVFRDKKNHILIKVKKD